VCGIETLAGQEVDQGAAEPPREAAEVNLRALRLAIADLTATFGEKYPRGAEFLRQLGELEECVRRGDPPPQTRAALVALQREALLANPLLDFDRLLVIQRRPLKDGKAWAKCTRFHEFRH
jgi:hypothetical protein